MNILRLFLLFAGFSLGALFGAAHATGSPEPHPPRPESSSTEKIPDIFVEDFGGGAGFRFQIRNVNINHQGNIVIVPKGGEYPVSMEILHDCVSCGNAVNQIIVGLGGEERAQVSVWNGKQRSGGSLKVVNPGSSVAAFAEDNPGSAEWVRVYFDIKIPDRPGVYYLRARYAQDYQGNLLTQAGLQHKQPIFEQVLDWWKVDRPNGPGPESNIGAVIVR